MVLVENASSSEVGSSATTRTVITEETDLEVVVSVSGKLRSLVLFCKAIGVKPSSLLTTILLGRLV